MESADFRDFIERSARAVDRALYLSESLDIMQDYKEEEKQEYVVLCTIACGVLRII